MSMFITFVAFSQEVESENEFEPEPKVATRGAGRKRAPPGEVSYVALMGVTRQVKLAIL